MRWSEQQAGQRPPPTAVMVHGILGSRKNMQAYARRLVEVCLILHQEMSFTNTQSWSGKIYASLCAFAACTHVGHPLHVSIVLRYPQNSVWVYMPCGPATDPGPCCRASQLQLFSLSVRCSELPKPTLQPCMTDAHCHIGISVMASAASGHPLPR